jgi:excinuclease ABC subunit C
MQDEWPVVQYVRRPLDDRADYFGPFTSSDAVRRAMRQLRKAFPYVTHSVNPMPKRGCLHYHIGLCPGPECGAITSAEYKRNLRRLMLYLHGHKTKLTDQLEREMKRAAGRRDFELAATRRNQLHNLMALGQQMIFSDKEAFDLAKDQALVGLADRLALKGLPRRIECYDISHMQGTDNVASMVVFTDGVPNKEEYRRFKMRLVGNDDYAHMREVMRRRFGERSGSLRDRTLREQWLKPDLIVIDGGKGQLSAATGVLDELGIAIPAIGLAKREEEIILRSGEVIVLPHSSHVLQLLQRIRDEAHRFAVTYHGLLRGKRQTASLLDEVPGVGPATRKKLIRAFGSVAGLKAAAEPEVAKVVGPVRAKAIAERLR